MAERKEIVVASIGDNSERYLDKLLDANTPTEVDTAYLEWIKDRLGDASDWKDVKARLNDLLILLIKMEKRRK